MKKFNKKIVKKILFIKSGAIGDVIMTTPLIRTVRNEFPEAEIQYCTGNWSKGVLENNKNIDKIIPFEEKIIFKKNIFKLLKLAKSLSKEKFDLCFVLDWSYLAGLFAAMCAPSAIRIGFNRNSEGFAHSIRVPYGDKKHDSQYYMDLAKAIGLKKEINNTKMELFPSKKDIAYANNFIKKNRIMGAIIGIAPGGASNPGQTVPLKRWPKKRYSELCNMILKKTKANIIFFGGKSDENIIRDIMNEIKIGSTNQNQIFNTVGKNTILQSAAMIKKCKVFISNDSGPMHIAAAVDTNTISIFGPTNPIKLAPLGKKHKYLWAKIKCAPCYKNGKFPKCSVKKCMNSIEEYVVFNEIKRKIKK